MTGPFKGSCRITSPGIRYNPGKLTRALTLFLIGIESNIKVSATMSYVVEMLNIRKEFPGIVANDNITLTLKKRGKYMHY